MIHSIEAVSLHDLLKQQEIYAIPSALQGGNVSATEGVKYAKQPFHSDTDITTYNRRAQTVQPPEEVVGGQFDRLV